MIKQIDKYFVIDFDRCLGDVVACYDLLKNLSHELYNIDKQKLQTAYDISLARGVSFSALDYIKDQNLKVDLELLEKRFLERAVALPHILLEPGAFDFMEYLESINQPCCIMSFGDKRWQMLKIAASGFGDVPIIITSDSQKIQYIRKWFDEDGGNFRIPGEYFLDNKPKRAREIVLVDDKVAAFKDMPSAARGYLVTGSAYDQATVPANAIPPSVKMVNNIGEIITLETQTKL